MTDRRVGVSRGRLVLGGLLVAIGLAWLLNVLGFRVRLEVILPVVLMAVGAALVLDARRGAPGGLIVLGIVLTVLLALGATFDAFSLPARAGEVVERPATINQLDRDYELGVGSLTVELSDLELSSATRVSASVGAGKLVVRVPPDAQVEVQAEVGIGQARAFRVGRGGLGVDLTHREPGTGQTLSLDLSVGIGDIDVRR